MSVSIIPGATTLTVTPRDPTSCATDFDEADQTRLRGCVVRLTGIARLPHDRADADDASAPLPDHRLEDGLREREYRRQVRRQHRIPIVAFQPDQQLVARDAGIVHQDVDPAVPSDDVGYRAIDVGGFRHVQRNRLDLSTSARQSPLPRRWRDPRARPPRRARPVRPAATRSPGRSPGKHLSRVPLDPIGQS